MATSAQHFKWLEQLYPKVFERLKVKIKSGQFGKPDERDTLLGLMLRHVEINGACWVEMDGNMPSGESLCRQFLYGQRYFKSRFDKQCDVLVLPDTCEQLLTLSPS